jgi:hypothetical protein
MSYKPKINESNDDRYHPPLCLIEYPFLAMSEIVKKECQKN